MPDGHAELATDALRFWHEQLARNGITRTVLLCSSFRSGSTYLAALLNKNGHAGLGKELFAQLRGKPGAELGAGAAHEKLEKILATAENGTFITKLMWPHRNQLARLFGYGRDQSAELAALFPNLRCIFMYREDFLGQVISHWRAEATQRWHSYRNDESEPDVKFDFETLQKSARILMMHAVLWKDFFKQAGITPFVLSYETLTQDTKATLQAVLDYLEESDRGAAREVVLQVGLKRQRDEKSAEIKRLYLERLYETGY